MKINTVIDKLRELQLELGEVDCTVNGQRIDKVRVSAYDGAVTVDLKGMVSAKTEATTKPCTKVSRCC